MLLVELGALQNLLLLNAGQVRSGQVSMGASGRYATVRYGNGTYSVPDSALGGPSWLVQIVAWEVPLRSLAAGAQWLLFFPFSFLLVAAPPPLYQPAAVKSVTTRALFRCFRHKRHR